MVFLKRTALCLLLVLVGSLAAAEEKISIAVMEMKVTNVSADEADLLIDFLNNALFDTGLFDVVQRSRRELLIKEIEFSLSDIAESAKTKALGKLLSSQLLVFGSLGTIGKHTLFNLSTVETETGKTVSSFSKTYGNLEEIVEDLSIIADDMARSTARSIFLKRARMLYSADFSVFDWPESDRLYYKEGRYHIYSPDQDWYAWQQKSFDDFIYEVEAEWLDGDPDAGFGVLFRLTDDENYYLFDITRSGFFKVDKKVDGTYYDVTKWEPSDVIEAEGINYLRIEAVGKTLSFYINNNKVKEVYDDSFLEGEFGLFAAMNVHAAFDNISIYQGNLLIYEPFESGNSAWVEDETAFIDDGAYTMRPDGTGYYSWRGETLADLSFQSDSRWLAGSDGIGYGLLFRVQDINNYYTFNISQNGFYRLALEIDSEWYDLVDWTKSRFINPTGKNLIRVEVIGANIRCYVNDNLVQEYEDATYLEGMIGFVTFADVHAAFDDVEVFLFD